MAWREQIQQSRAGLVDFMYPPWLVNLKASALRRRCGLGRRGPMGFNDAGGCAQAANDARARGILTYRALQGPGRTFENQKLIRLAL